MDNWGITGGGWGDVFVSLSNAKRRNIRNIILLGPFPELKEFILAQDFVDNCEHYLFTPAESIYWQSFVNLCSPWKTETQINEYKVYFNLPQDREYTSIQLSVSGGEDLSLLDTYNYSSRAYEYLPDYEDFILFQPSSNHSTPDENKWKYWPEFLNEVCEFFPNNKVILIGQGNQGYNDIKYPNFIDLRDKFSSAEGVALFAEKAKLIITLPNNLIYWLHVKNKPVISISNKEFNLLSPFKRLLIKPTLIDLEFDVTYEDAVNTLHNWEALVNRDRKEITCPYKFISKFTMINQHTVNDLYSNKSSMSIYRNIMLDNKDVDWFFFSEIDIKYLYSVLNILGGNFEVGVTLNETLMEQYNNLEKYLVLRKYGAVKNPFVICSKTNLESVLAANVIGFICIGDNIYSHSLQEYEVVRYQEFMHGRRVKN